MNSRRLRFFLARALHKTLSPVVPARMKLPFRFRLRIMEGSVENELLYLDRICPRGAAAIDAGANEGLFSLALSKRFASVHAFEINDALTANLAAFNPGNIHIVHTGLSSREGEATLFIPVSCGIPLTGWGSLLPGNCPEASGHIEKNVTLRPLDSFGLRSVAFMKIDVEGHELELLAGAQETLRRERPTVLIEVKEQTEAEVARFFERLNYRRETLEALAGIAGSPENRIFVPASPSHA